MEAKGPARVLHGCDVLQALLGREEYIWQTPEETQTDTGILQCHSCTGGCHFQHSAQGVQYFRLMGKQFSDPSEITYAMFNNTSATRQRQVAQGTRHPREPKNQTGPQLHLTFPHLSSSPLPRGVKHSFTV